MTVTSTNHGMVTGNRVQFERDSIRFRCKMDGRNPSRVIQEEKIHLIKSGYQLQLLILISLV